MDLDSEEGLPAYADLEYREALRGRVSWGVFGADDELGTLNLLTPRRVMEALAVPQDGKRVCLTLPLDQPSPGTATRPLYRHHVIQLRGGMLDDYLDNFYLQGSSQWDALRHVPAGRAGWYNGYDESAAGIDAVDPRLGIDSMSGGILARGVLVDAVAFFAAQGTPLTATEGRPVTVEDLRAILAFQGTSLRVGDVVLLRTGWLESLMELTEEERISRLEVRVWPGLHGGEEMAEFLWDQHIAAIAADNRAVEVAPTDRAAGFLHRRLIGMLGIPMGELWDLRELSMACRQRNRYEFLLASVPLRIPGGIGSPANAIAVL